MWWYWVIDSGGGRAALDVAFEARNVQEFEALAIRTAPQARKASYIPKLRIYNVLSLTALDANRKMVYPAGALPHRAMNEKGKLHVDPKYPDDDETLIRKWAGRWWESAEFAFSYREELCNPP